MLNNYGVAFRNFTEPCLDTCGIFKEAVIAIVGTIAKQERIRIFGASPRRFGARQEKRHQNRPANRSTACPFSAATRWPSCERKGSVGARLLGRLVQASEQYAGYYTPSRNELCFGSLRMWQIISSTIRQAHHGVFDPGPLTGRDAARIVTENCPLKRSDSIDG
jgi:hypothetical protein